MEPILSKKFRNETLEMLITAKVKNPEIIINNKYKETIKTETIKHLKHIIKLIENNEYDEVMNLLSHSPAGDGYGSDNYYIDFSFLDPDTEKNYLSDIQDLNDVINILKINKS